MLQDLGEMQYHIEFETKDPQAGDLIFYFQEGKALLKNTLQNRAITYEEFCSGVQAVGIHYQYLFCIDQINVFLARCSRDVTVSTEFVWEKPVVFRGLIPHWQGFAGVTASSLARWYGNNRFCGCCGHPMTPSTMERAMVCDQCGQVVYPRISPAVIVGVVDGDRIILTRYANRSFTRHALIAGFVEAGETFEATIHREVMEEVGVRVKNIRYFGSQPWSFSDSILAGFFADLDGDDSLNVDHQELATAQWFTRESIPEDPENGISLTYTMMMAFAQRKETK